MILGAQQAMKDERVEVSMPAEKIILTGVAQNTAQEAQAVKQALANQVTSPQHKLKIVLVTSAFHMQRSTTLFERAGFVVEPFAVDFQVSQAQRLNILDVLPDAAALKQTETALRELYGRAYYALKRH